MLEGGGTAADAVVAMAFCLSVTEPWFSGLGGGAWIVGQHGPSGKSFVINGPITAPAAADEHMYTLAHDEGTSGFYGWPTVVDDENILGFRSIGVPGQVAALCRLHQGYGALTLQETLEPAISLAADGHEVDWLAGVLIARSAREIARFPVTAEVFTPGGFPLCGPVLSPGDRLVQPALADTLRAVAGGGARAFYEGRISAAITNAVQAGGGILAASDMSDYTVDIGAPVAVPVGNHTLLGSLLTGFPTVVQILQSLRRGGTQSTAAPDATTWAAATAAAFEDRFALMSTNPSAQTPWDRLMGPAPAVATPGPSTSQTLPRPGCTSHLTAVDGEGTVISATQTVLDLFGSRYLEPETGVLLNDGMMYFDPRPARVNSVRPGLPGLTAVSPVLLERDGDVVAALGASGGRRIISAVSRVVDGLMRGQGIEAAIGQPRVHAEGSSVWLDPEWADEAAGLRSLGFTPTVAAEQPTTFLYARVNGVSREHPGASWQAGADKHKPYGVSAARSE